MRNLLSPAATCLATLLLAGTADATTLMLALDRSRAAEFASLDALLDPAQPRKDQPTIAVEMIGINKPVGDPVHTVDGLDKLLETAAVIATQPATLSIPASLAKLDRRVAAIAAPGERRIIVILSDLNLSDPDTRGKALSDAWMTNPVSPLVREWLSKDGGGGFKDADIIVFTKGNEPLSVRRAREGFFANAFAKAGGRLRYFGPAPRGPGGMIFGRDLIAATLANTIPPVTLPPVATSPILQLLDQTGATSTIEYHNVPTQ